MASASNSLAITVFRSFVDAEPDWRKLQQAGVCYAFQTFEWLSSWHQIIGQSEGAEPYIVLVSDGHGRAMLIPLGLRRWNGVSVLRFLGGAVTDYNAPIIREDFAKCMTSERLQLLWASILGQLPRADIVHFRRMPLLVEDVANPLVHIAGSVHTETAHFAKLTGSFQEYKDALSDRLKVCPAKGVFKLRELRRQRRRLSEKGKLTYQVASSKAVAEEIMQATVRQKTRHWQETGAPAFFSSPENVNFYQKVGVKEIQSGFVHIAALRVNDTILATDWSTVFRGRYCALLGSFEAGEWAKYSPGRLLTEDTIDWCFANEIATYDLTVGDEAYKQAWADHRLPLYEHISALTTVGRCLVSANKAVYKVRRKVAPQGHLHPMWKMVRPLKRLVQW
jgi:CelD/BcsL family acetyltransferase involved in cellulose biosynthesis